MSIRQHGFTRTTLAHSVLSLPEPHFEPLSDSAVTTLFGEGDTARRTLINAWLDEGIVHIRTAALVSNVKDALLARLEYNVPALDYLTEAFALVASPGLGIPPLDLRPAVQHAASIADEACRVAGDTSIGPSWYTKRATLAAIYTAAELHQLASPQTAPGFLGSLFDSASDMQSVLSEAENSRSMLPRAGQRLPKVLVYFDTILQAGKCNSKRRAMGPVSVRAMNSLSV
ncbi:hypothetical protein B0F90DRAFT_1815975 [Multifurca ochricompacta]|uniref:COQ9 C-terminal domain-containing protein n=1 Tax=Multifurca ochricompacta TaxID=376703 RepID=A0AAD4M6F6_9AGAM|nr:hypothetical protein B0F90DRAFT_1815975 [Multifurca ochricompacta]